MRETNAQHMYSEARDTGDAELWLLIHKVGESRTCYDNPSTNVTRFDAPPNLMAGVATGVTIVMGFTCTFFIAGSLCICVFLNPTCLLYTSPSPRDATLSRMPSSA